MTPSYRQTVEAGWVEQERYRVEVAYEVLELQAAVDLCNRIWWSGDAKLETLQRLMGELLTHQLELEALEVGV